MTVFASDPVFGVIGNQSVLMPIRAPTPTPLDIGKQPSLSEHIEPVPTGLQVMQSVDCNQLHSQRILVVAAFAAVMIPVALKPKSIDSQQVPIGH